MEEIYKLEDMILDEEEKLYQLKVCKLNFNKKNKKYDKHNFMVLLTKIKAQEGYIKYLKNRKESLERLYRRSI